MTNDEDTPWLDPDERAAWLALVALSNTLPATIDAQLQRDAGLSHFQYTVLAMLSESPDHQRRMADLASIANGSLSRLSHAAKKLEERGLIERSPLPENGRITVATLTPAGHDLVVTAAPAHVRHVRAQVLSGLAPGQARDIAYACLSILAALDPAAHDAVKAAANLT